MEMTMGETDFPKFILATTVLLAACEERHQTAAVPSPSAASNPSATPTTAPAAANDPADKWLGRWAGVEGTHLNLSKKGDRYVVTIANLDGPKTYEGVAAGDHIEFQRDGKTESIRAASGKETGMKWLAGEKNCLVVKFASEGFCRK